MCNICNIRLPQAMGDVISSIGIGIGIGIDTAAADSIGYRAPARYRSNPTLKLTHCRGSRSLFVSLSGVDLFNDMKDKRVFCSSELTFQLFGLPRKIRS